MHPTTRELLALRDGEAAPEAARHVAGCAQCAAELERLESLRQALQSLPELRPAEDGWPRLQEALARRKQRRWRSVMAAAAIVAGIGLVAAWVSTRPASDQPAAAPVAVSAPALDELVLASRRLESVLQAPALRSPVLSPREAARIVALEDRIALIDINLTGDDRPLSADRAVALWTDRVELLDALVQARGGSSSAGEYRKTINTMERSIQ